MRDITYDAADRIVSYTHYDALQGATSAATALNQSFVYDELGRLTNIVTGASWWSIGYDANGNRTSVTVSGNASSYTTSPSSNRLNAISNPARSFGYDNAGNTTSDSTSYTSTYDLAGRLTTLSKAGTTSSYTYDAQGRRVRKVASSGSSSTVIFVYDQGGQLLGEYDSAGNALREYVWLGSTPVAMFVPDPTPSNPPLVYFIHADHIDTPRIVVDRSDNLRWRWMAEPFGTTAPETNPASLGAFTLNLRFPGQYFDQESGLHYNYFRFYDSSTGRFPQFDPIGLAGGSMSGYDYVGSNPLSFVDPTGLVKHTTGRWIDCGKGCRIRIDYTLNESTGVVRRHLHWECKGREGTCGENGEQSHGESWDDAPEHIKQCALRHGFNGGRVPAPPAGAAGAPTPFVAGDPRDLGSNGGWNPFSPPWVYDPRLDRMVPGAGPQNPSVGPLPGPGPIPIFP